MKFQKLYLLIILCLFSNVSWSGECLQGDCKNGPGTYLWDNGDKYVGEFSNGLPNGEGLITTADGDVYEGGFKNSKFHGHGKWSRANGDVYVGEFNDNDPHGSGIYKVSDGRTIEGTFTKGQLTAGILISQDGSATDVITGEPIERSTIANSNATDAITVAPVDSSSATNIKVDKSENRNSAISKQKYVLREECKFIEDAVTGDWTLSAGKLIEADCKDGQGSFTWTDGTRYVGEYQDNLPHGQGTYTWASGSKYVGEIKNDKRHGQGTHTWTDGTRYVGEWKDDKRHGQGTFTWASGSKYVGEWKDSKRTGQGTYTWANGNKYVGEWKDSKRTGQGTFTWASGSKYVGEYKDDKRHGQGTTNYHDGSKYVGEWKDDKRHGQGTGTWDGNKYVGEWKDDDIDGYGTFTVKASAQGIMDTALSNPEIDNTMSLGLAAISGVTTKKEWIRAGESRDGSPIGFANINITHALIAREYVNHCASYGFMRASDAANLYEELTNGIKVSISKNLVTRDWLNKKNNDVKMAAKLQKPLIEITDLRELCREFNSLNKHFIVIRNEF